jgi:hypothetical protein
LRTNGSVPNDFSAGHAEGHLTAIQPADILTPQELAKRLKVPLSWIYKQSARHGPAAIPVLRCGMYLRFSWPDVCAWLRSKESS